MFKLSSRSFETDNVTFLGNVQQCQLFMLIFVCLLQIADAVDKYRDAMQSWAAHQDMFKTDLLQVKSLD